MKLRLHGPHVRLRLGPRDVAALLEAGEVVSELTPGFRYGLRLGRAWALDAAGGLLVTAPAGTWCRGGSLTLAGRCGAVTVSLERDLPCRDGRDADDPNVYHDPPQPDVDRPEATGAPAPVLAPSPPLGDAVSTRASPGAGGKPR